MDQLREVRAINVEDVPQIDLLQRELGFTAYKVVSSEDLTGQSVVRGEATLVYRVAEMNRSFVDEPMLPIEEFSK